ncbi:MAG TPA: prolyl oligopeptidase family serine peptidase [Planctomycetota bacterium]|nr:prolyl oligopeptidase family serine peptidase [Planctomycetota bacterium]
MRCPLLVISLLSCLAARPAPAQQGPTRKPGARGQPVCDEAQSKQPFPLASMKLPPLPDLPALTRRDDGVFFGEVEVKWPRGTSKLWIYLPDSDNLPKSLPCVLVPPAGSNLLFGMDLGDGDRDEHLPYCKQGFAVIAFEIEGVMPVEDQQSDANVLRQMRRFLDCEAGLQDARLALEYALAKVPAIDPKRIFCAGHSSAGTLALLFAAHEPRLRGCAAFAPIADVEQRIPDDAEQQIEQDFAGYRNFLVRGSPVTHLARITAPLFVFAAEDDSNVPFADTKTFVERLRKARKTVEFDTVPTGDHYQPMIDSGIPQAIAWMQALCAKGARPDAPKKQ